MNYGMILLFPYKGALGMTTIVVDIKNAKAYSDTLTSTRHFEVVGGVKIYNLVKQTSNQYKKIYSYDDYVIVGTGCMDTLKSFAENYVNDVLVPPKNETIIAVLSKRQKAISSIIFESIEEEQSLWERLLKRPKRYTWKSKSKLLTGDWYTFGSGKYIAIGALKAGSSIQEAFSIVATIDSGTNDEIVSFYIP